MVFNGSKMKKNMVFVPFFFGSCINSPYMGFYIRRAFATHNLFIESWWMAQLTTYMVCCMFKPMRRSDLLIL